MSTIKFPEFSRMIGDFIYEEEANISRKKIISVGSMLVLATLLMATEAFAGHSSHSSHRSHSSHSSHSSGSGGHSSHESHVSHTSHVSSTTTHSNHSSHSNHSNHASGTHASHSSHSSAATAHTSHASATRSVIPSHSNTGISEPVEPVTRGVIPDDATSEMIDIRVPLIPPDSPLINGAGD